MIPGSNFKALLSFLWTVSFFALLSSQGVEAQPAGSSFSLLPHRRYTTSFTAPILYRYSWGIDGARVSFGPVGSNGMYLSRKSLGTGTTIGQSQIDDCAAFCEMTNDCGFFHAIQLKGASDTNLICATYDGKMSKSTATLIKGPSFGGSAKVVYSYGFTRNSGPVSNPIASLSSTAATGVCTAKSSSTSTGSSTKATTTAAASTKATSATTSSSTAAVSTATSQAQFALYQDYWGTSSTGLPDPADIPGVTIYNLAFWLSDTGPADTLLHFTSASASARAAILKKYKAAGIKVLVSAFGSTDRPQTNLNATAAAASLAKLVLDYNLDGVDIDYEQFDTFAEGLSVSWLITLTKELRKRLPSPLLITHAPVAPWLVRELYPSDGGYAEINKQVGSMIDYYFTQFYNQDSYTTKNGQLYDGGNIFPGSSLFEIINNQGFPAEKMVVGKPAQADDASNGYIAPKTLGNILLEAKNKGWTGGMSLWQNRLDGTAANMVSTVKSITGF